MRNTSLVVLGILLSGTSVPIVAQETGSQTEIRVDGQTLFALHYGVGSITPAGRADHLRDRQRR